MKQGEQLAPSIFRHEQSSADKIKIEKEIYSDFYNLIRGHDVSRNLQSAWELLCYAQHIGVPTRLLDWTINPLIAAFFAVEDAYQPSKPDGIIFALNVSSFDPQPKGDERLGFRGHLLANLESGYPFLKYFQSLGSLQELSDIKSNSEVLVIQPPIIDARIQAQAALFTVNLKDQRPHHAVFGEYLTRLTIRRADKANIKTQLYRMGIHAGSVYPDVNGIGRYLVDRRDRENWLKNKGRRIKPTSK